MFEIFDKNNIFLKDKLLGEWMLSSFTPIFKGKGDTLKGKVDALNLNAYRVIKLLEHAFKLYEKVLDGFWMSW